MSRKSDEMLYQQLRLYALLCLLGLSVCFSAHAAEAEAHQFIYKPVILFTQLSLKLNSSAILNEDTINVAGKLNHFPIPEEGGDLSDLEIELTITAPDGAETVLRTDTHSNIGQYEFPGTAGFTQEGLYQLQTRFAGTGNLAEATSEPQSVLVGQSAGYALIVQGRISNGEGLKSHDKTLSRIYNRLKEQGFTDENIQYFNYNPEQAGVDGIPGKAAIQDALADLQGRMNGSPAPFYLILAGHGWVDGSFFIDNGDNERIMPDELAVWLDGFEAGLSPQALEKPRIIIVGTCYSGAVIPALSRPGRIIITSAAADEESFKGLIEPDGVRSGELFMEEFFQELGRGRAFKTAFEKAAEVVKITTRRGGTPDNFSNGFQELAHPLLDDNGDGQGSNVLSLGGDGGNSENLYLGMRIGYAAYPYSPDSPAEIISTPDTIFLGPDESSAVLFIGVNNPRRVNVASVYVRPPSTVLERDDQAFTEQQEIDGLMRAFLLCSQEMNRCEGDVNIFDEPGRYEAFYFVTDIMTGDSSPVRHSVIYKQQPGNPAPDPFNLLLPGDGETTKTVLIFDWEEAFDPNGDALNYTLSVAADREFNSVVYTQEELPGSMTYIDDTAIISDGRDDGMPGLRDQTTYYWKVTAVDSFGGQTESPVHSFYTNNPNCISVVLHVKPVNASNYGTVPGAIVQLDKPAEACGFPAASSSINGSLFLLPGAIEVSGTVQAPGFLDATFTVSAELETVSVNVLMSPDVPSVPGTLQFSVASALVAENENHVSVLLERVQGYYGAIRISYATVDDTAEAGSDYEAVTGQLVWSHQDMRLKQIVIPIRNDTDFEGNEVFFIELSSPQGGATLGEPVKMGITIVDDEDEDVSLPSLGHGIRLIEGKLDKSTDALFAGGIAVDGEIYQADITLEHPGLATDPVVIMGQITADASHIGQAADILVIAGYKPHGPEAIEEFFMLDTERAPQSLGVGAVPGSLAAAEKNVILTEMQAVNLYNGPLVDGRIRIFFGYRLQDGQVVFNGEQAIDAVVY
ncbi:MAG: hypothetical protein GY862_09025 [Gammaproteobacteria bacterium]|nr:hypothetical protein [Gammaproteobacteria bacterium]